MLVGVPSPAREHPRIDLADAGRSRGMCSACSAVPGGSGTGPVIILDGAPRAAEAERMVAEDPHRVDEGRAVGVRGHR